MPHAIRRVDVAGRDVSRALETHLRKSGCNLSTSAEREVVRTIKEKACFVALDPKKSEDDHKSAELESFKLPDGNIIKVSDLFFFEKLFGH